MEAKNAVYSFSLPVEQQKKIIAKEINESIRQIKEDGLLETNDISDGCHTFGELYEHRISIYMALCSVISKFGDMQTDVWKSKLHSDGSSFEGWFVLGMSGLDKGSQITYHLPMNKWDECVFAETRERAPEWDGHTSADVLERLKSF